MGRPRQVSDDEILQAAREAWLDDPRASTARIAARVGLSEAAIFKRFRTKIRLMLKAFGVHRGPPWVALVEQGPDDRPLEQQLDEIGAAVDTFFRKIIPRIAVLRGIGLSAEEMFGDDDEPPPLIGLRALSAWFGRAQARGLVDDHHDPEALALSFIGVFQGRAFWRQLFRDRVPVDDRVYLEQVVRVFSRGLSPAEGAP